MPPGYQYAIWIGLAFSLVGDIFLMLPGHHFVKGLAAFLIAHICYIGAFYLPVRQVDITKTILIFIGLGLLVGRLIAPGLGKLKVPVFIYMLVIITMGWQAFTLWRLSPIPQAGLALIGALLFILSDSILAINRFRYKFYLAQACILSTYYLAQWLIARSI